MSALFTSLARALGGVAVCIVVVALVWTIYINRQAVAELAAPLVTPLVESAANSPSQR
jgi:hypothetical protein